MLTCNGYMLRIYLGERDKHEGKPLYEWLLGQAKERGLAGGTVIRAFEGFGAHGSIHSAKLLDLATELPLIIEIVDEKQKIEDFLPILDSVLKEGLAAIEEVHIRLYRAGKQVM